MRTTLSLDDDVLRAVRAYAKRRDITIGKAISDLVRNGLQAGLQTRLVNGIQVFDLPPDSPVVSTEHVKKLLDELDMKPLVALARPARRVRL